MNKIKLADARTELLLTQQQLHKLSGVSTKVISNAEQGASIRRITAQALLRVLNNVRADLGKPALGLKDLDWKISGDGDGEDKKESSGTTGK